MLSRDGSREEQSLVVEQIERVWVLDTRGTEEILILLGLRFSFFVRCVCFLPNLGGDPVWLSLIR